MLRIGLNMNWHELWQASCRVWVLTHPTEPYDRCVTDASNTNTLRIEFRKSDNARCLNPPTKILIFCPTEIAWISHTYPDTPPEPPPHSPYTFVDTPVYEPDDHPFYVLLGRLDLTGDGTMALASGTTRCTAVTDDEVAERFKTIVREREAAELPRRR